MLNIGGENFQERKRENSQIEEHPGESAISLEYDIECFMEEEHQDN